MSGGVGNPTLPAASLARRLAALLYEGTLLSAIVVMVGFLLAPAVSRLSPNAPLQVPDLAGRAFMFCGLFMAGALYFGWSWSGGRRTLPMKTWRLRLTARTGAVVDGRRALIRYAAAWIGPAVALASYAMLKPGAGAKHAMWLLALGYVWALADPDRQFLHDRVAGTRLVKSDS